LGSSLFYLFESLDIAFLKSIKAVRFTYRPTVQTLQLLHTFREMVNRAIQICLAENIKGRLNLRNRIYREFRERYGVQSSYPYSVAEIAWSIVRKHRRWQRKPVAQRLMLKMDSASYSLNNGMLSLPHRKNGRIRIPLTYGDYQRLFLADPGLKRGSLTMTNVTIIIAFSKESVPVEPLSKVGIDVNEKSAVLSDGSRYDLSEVARLHTEYWVRRRRFYRKHPHDERLKKKFSVNSREKARVKQLLNRVSKTIVQNARDKKQAIVLERLKGIRFANMRGNGKSRASRRRIALWPFRQLQHQIDYKANWEGLRVEYVSGAWTSKTCSICGNINRGLKLSDRSWRCPCGATHDRDYNAAQNIVARSKIECLPMVLAEAQSDVKL